MYYITNIEFYGQNFKYLVQPSDELLITVTLYDDVANKSETKTLTYGELKWCPFPKPKFGIATTSRRSISFIDYIDYVGVVHDIPYFSFDLDRFDYISEDCCFLRVLNKKSDWRSIMDILATGKYYRYSDKVYIYKSDNKWYCYRITDVDKFDLLYTKLQVFRKEE